MSQPESLLHTLRTSVVLWKVEECCWRIDPLVSLQLNVHHVVTHHTTDSTRTSQVVTHHTTDSTRTSLTHTSTTSFPNNGELIEKTTRKGRTTMRNWQLKNSKSFVSLRTNSNLVLGLIVRPYVHAVSCQQSIVECLYDLRAMWEWIQLLWCLGIIPAPIANPPHMLQRVCKLQKGAHPLLPALEGSSISGDHFGFHATQPSSMPLNRCC